MCARGRVPTFFNATIVCYATIMLDKPRNKGDKAYLRERQTDMRSGEEDWAEEEYLENTEEEVSPDDEEDAEGDERNDAEEEGVAPEAHDAEEKIIPEID